MDTQSILTNIAMLKTAIERQTNPNIKLKFEGKLKELQEKLAESEAKVEKKEEKADLKEKKDASKDEQDIKNLEAAIEKQTNPKIKEKFKKKLAELKEKKLAELKEKQKEVKEEKKVEQKNIGDAGDKIKKLEKAIANAEDDDVKKKYQKKLKELKESLSEVKEEIKQEAKKPVRQVKAAAKPVRKTPIKKAAPAPTPSPRKKKLKGVLAELDALIEKNRQLKAKYGTSYKGTGKPSDLERDSKRKAKPFGYRFVGKHNYRVPTEMEIKKGLKRGTIDYEARPNRADVSVKRKVKLEDGGMMAKGGEVKRVTDGDDTYYLTYIDSTHFYLSNSKDYKGNAFHIAEFRSRPFYDEVKSWLKSHKGEMMADGGQEYGGMMAKGGNGKVIEYKKGGKTKEKWIQDALAGKKGVLRATAKRKGLLRGDENLSKTDLKKLQKVGGKTAKQAHLAETLSKFKKGGKVGYSDEDKARFAKPAGWRWKEEAFKKGFITRTQLAQKPSKYMREKYPTMVYYEDRLNKSDKKPTRTSAPSV